MPTHKVVKNLDQLNFKNLILCLKINSADFISISNIINLYCTSEYILIFVLLIVNAEIQNAFIGTDYLKETIGFVTMWEFCF